MRDSLSPEIENFKRFGLDEREFGNQMCYCLDQYFTIDRISSIGEIYVKITRRAA
jgi:hypothetical protein